MTGNERSLESMISEAQKLGKEQEELENKNKRRKAKGRPPLPDIQEKKDLQVSKRKYRTGDSTTVDGVDAMKLFELRKAQMSGDDDDLEDDEEELLKSDPSPANADKKPVGASPMVDVDSALREAEAVRRVQDLKNGRIDHEGNWSSEGQNIDGGDKAVVVDKPGLDKIWGNKIEENGGDTIYFLEAKNILAAYENQKSISSMQEEVDESI